MSEESFSLVPPFDTDDPEFCRGVEAGALPPRSPADFDPPSPDGKDRIEALAAAAEVRGDLIRPERPRCHGYANCCHCHVCKTRSARKSVV